MLSFLYHLRHPPDQQIPDLGNHTINFTPCGGTPFTIVKFSARIVRAIQGGECVAESLPDHTMRFIFHVSVLYHLFNFCDCLEDRIDLLRYYRVSETSQSVHPMGNPISHSTNSGFKYWGWHFPFSPRYRLCEPPHSSILPFWFPETYHLILAADLRLLHLLAGGGGDPVFGVWVHRDHSSLTTFTRLFAHSSGR
jgi:hypothetical protein